MEEVAAQIHAFVCGAAQRCGRWTLAGPVDAWGAPTLMSQYQQLSRRSSPCSHNFHNFQHRSGGRCRWHSENSLGRPAGRSGRGSILHLGRCCFPDTAVSVSVYTQTIIPSIERLQVHTLHLLTHLVMTRPAVVYLRVEIGAEIGAFGTRGACLPIPTVALAIRTGCEVAVHLAAAIASPAM